MEASTELKNIVLRFYEAVSRGDSTFLERLISREDGAIVIGTDPNEWWEGYATIIPTYKKQLEEMAGFAIVGGNPQAYSEGTVGWAADRAKFRLPNGAEVPFRMTSVFRREDGEWKLLQQHVSVGVLNEEAIGKELSV
ncbi:MAG: nuclear transport factor 2 family protein [Chloroflexota bacterium]|nr:nuclear transport factor 2 family protein [Chloroflexota bacterium]